MAGDKQSANQATVFKAREVAIEELGPNPIFQTREPNSFGDFGGEPTLVARRPFSQSRQRKKGSSVDIDNAAGWNEDFTFNNMQSVLDSFCFAEARVKPKTTATAALAAGTMAVASIAGFVANTLVLVKGFKISTNNGLKLVTAAAGGNLSIAGLVDEAGAEATVEVVGHRFAAGDISLSLVGGKARLTSAAMDMTTYGLIPGEWIVVGGQEAANNFDTTLRGYARIGVEGVTEDYIELDKTTFVAANNAGAAKLIDIYFGTVIKNEDDPDLIVKLTDTIERPLGRDDLGRMSEVITGATANELTWTSPLANLVNVDVAYVGMKHIKRKGDVGLLSAEAGTTLTKALGEDGWNTSRNVFRLRMTIIDPNTLNPTPLFGKVTEWSATINNNVTGDKAQGEYGAFDTTEGGFDVDGEWTVYFKDMRAGQAIDDDADVTVDAIYSKKNMAFVFDLPLVALGGGRPTVEQDTAIMLPLTTAAAESPFGHTVLFNWLSYVPNYANATG